MKLKHHVFSGNGILVVTMFSLMVAVFLWGMSILQAANEAPLDLPPAVANSLMMYVLIGVKGEIPSTAGTLLSWGFVFGYVVTPFLASVMFAVKVSIGTSEEDADTAVMA